MFEDIYVLVCGVNGNAPVQHSILVLQPEGDFIPTLKSSASIRQSPGQPWTYNILSYAVLLLMHNMTTNGTVVLKHIGAVAKLAVKVHGETKSSGLQLCFLD